MLKVRPGPTGDELERYYGFDMALDHAAELLGVAVADLPVPGLRPTWGCNPVSRPQIPNVARSISRLPGPSPTASTVMSNSSV